VNEDTLMDMVQHLTDKVGLVHQLPRMMDGDLRFSRVVEKVSSIRVIFPLLTNFCYLLVISCC